MSRFGVRHPVGNQQTRTFSPFDLTNVSLFHTLSHSSPPVTSTTLVPFSLPYFADANPAIPFFFPFSSKCGSADVVPPMFTERAAAPLFSLFSFFFSKRQSVLGPSKTERTPCSLNSFSFLVAQPATSPSLPVFSGLAPPPPFASSLITVFLLPSLHDRLLKIPLCTTPPLAWEIGN